MYQEKTALSPSAYFDGMKTMGLSLVVLMLTLCATRPANAASGQFVAHNTPNYVATAKNLGTEDPSKTIEVSIWLSRITVGRWMRWRGICMIEPRQIIVTG